MQKPILNVRCNYKKIVHSDIEGSVMKVQSLLEQNGWCRETKRPLAAIPIQYCKWRTLCPLLDTNCRISLAGTIPWGKALTKLQQGKIFAWKGEKVTQTVMENHLSRSRKVIGHCLANRGVYGAANQSGRPRKFTANDTRRLIQEESKGEQTANALRKNLHLGVSRRRVQYYLQ